MSTPFHETLSGCRFFDRTLPELLHELTRLNDTLERLVERLPEPSARRDEGEGS